MARTALRQYVFYPSGTGYGNVQVPGNWTNGQILTIVDTTNQQFIQNFADPTLGATFTYSGAGVINSNFPNGVDGFTTITFTGANTSTALGFASTDKLAIYAEQGYQSIKAWPFGTDAVERMRTANPQSLIDADFEYGLQTTKWQSLFTNVDQPSIYEVPGSDSMGFVNVAAYVTTLGNTITAGSAANVVILNNQFTNVAANLTTAGGLNSNIAPNWTQYDYALLTGMGGGGYPAAGTVWGATATYLTANVVNVNNRALPVASSTGYGIGNIVAIAYIPWQNNTTVGAAQASTFTSGVNQLNTTANLFTQGATNGMMLAVQTNTLNVWELMTIVGITTATAGGGNILVYRNCWGTNSGNATISAGNAVRVVNLIELANVTSVDSSTQISVNRGFLNTQGIDQLYSNSIVQNTYIDPALLSGGNTEIAQMGTIQSGFGAGGNIAQLFRGVLGTTPAAQPLGAGALVVRLAGFFTAGNANVAVVGVNYPGNPFVANSTAVNGAISTFGHATANSEGQYQIITQPGPVVAQSPNYFTYYPRKQPTQYPIGYQLNAYNTILRRAGFFAGGNIPFLTITSNGATPSVLTVTTPYAHGLSPAIPVLINLWQNVGSGWQYGSGSFTVLTVPTPTSFTVTGKPNGVVQSGVNYGGTIYVRPSAYFTHRPVDGGVLIGCGTPSHGALAARQTKKYFRYQSGKGLMWTSGTLLGTNVDVSNVTANATAVGSSITVVTDQEHFLQAGANVQISGVTTSGYNNQYTVYTVTSDYSFTVNAVSALGATVASLTYQPKVAVSTWSGATVRAGLFDDQNGAFWENTGTQLNCVVRSATWPLAGYVSVEVGSNQVTGDGATNFLAQYSKWDRVVIRGMTHTIVNVQDTNTLQVSPPFRGASNQYRVKMSKVTERRYPQAQWNIDRLDGTGPSGYVINPVLMQMLMIQYTWYGAGFCEFGLRGPRGEMIMAHRATNNNANYQAWMRTGNLPARYSAQNDTPATFLANAMSSTDAYMVITDSTQFPIAQLSSAYPTYVLVDNEVMAVTGTISVGPTVNGVTPANLTVSTRGANWNMWQDGQIKNFSMGSAATHNLGNTVVVVNNTNAPSLNHWGSAIILDGGFDKDQGYQYTYVAANIAFPAGGTVSPTTAFAMRLAPSVSNGLPAPLGSAELINRAQLILNNMVVNFQGPNARFLLEGILNPNNISTTSTTFNFLYNNSTSTTNNPSGVVQPSFTQIANVISYTQGTYAFGGERLFSIPVSFTNSGTLDLSAVKQIGNSGIPGQNVYPDGPELLAINITSLTSLGGTGVAGEIQIQFSESQA